MISLNRQITGKSHLKTTLCVYVQLICLFVFPVIAFGANAASSTFLNIVCDDKFPPYEFSDNKKLTGYSVEIVKAVLDRMEIQYKIDSFPWKRAENMVISGDADALFSASYLDLRTEACWYPLEQLFESIYVFFIQKKD